MTEHTKKTLELQVILSLMITCKLKDSLSICKSFAGVPILPSERLRQTSKIFSLTLNRLIKKPTLDQLATVAFATPTFIQLGDKYFKNYLAE